MLLAISVNEEEKNRLKTRVTCVWKTREQSLLVSDVCVCESEREIKYIESQLESRTNYKI